MVFTTRLGVGIAQNEKNISSGSLSASAFPKTAQHLTTSESGIEIGDKWVQNPLSVSRPKTLVSFVNFSSEKLKSESESDWIINTQKLASYFPVLFRVQKICDIPRWPFHSRLWIHLEFHPVFDRTFPPAPKMYLRNLMLWEKIIIAWSDKRCRLIFSYWKFIGGGGVKWVMTHIFYSFGHIDLTRVLSRSEGCEKVNGKAVPLIMAQSDRASTGPRPGPDKTWVALFYVWHSHCNLCGDL